MKKCKYNLPFRVQQLQRTNEHQQYNTYGGIHTVDEKTQIDIFYR